MNWQGNWSFPTPIRFGPGRIKELPAACRRTGMTRPLLVTDPGLAALPMIDAALRSLREAGLEAGLFCGVKPNPTGANVEAGIAAYRAGGHDGVIAFGGGSALDCGKAIAFMQGQSGTLWDYQDQGGGWRQADAAAMAPVVAVPTTAGTGAEVGRAAVIVRESRQEKLIIFHPKMMPAMVIADPELTLGLPPGLTAGAGMDAFAHSLEAWCAPGFHPYCDGIALEGVRLVKEALPRALADGADLGARAQLLAAASMGATAFQKGLGAIHALSHPIGALHDCHHGMTNAVVMPYVLAFNRPAIEGKMPRLAAYLGLEGGFDGIMDWLLAFRAQVGVPQTLRDFGIDDSHADRIAAMAAADSTATTNPRPFGAAEARQVLDAAWAGAL